MDIRPVRPEHQRELAAFCCAVPGQEYTLEVEEEIRLHLPDELARGEVQALGSWDGEKLVALIAFVPARLSTLWKVTVLATDRGYRRRKQASRLKLAVLRMAAEAGVGGLVSCVHRDNHPMIALNRKLGGEVESSPDPDDPRRVCMVPVQRRR